MFPLKSILILLIISNISIAQTISKIDTGRINGAAYKIIFPTNWQKKLVMYAHGYEFMGAKPAQSQNPEFAKRMQPFLDRGFAVAASDYAYQGLALAQGTDDTEALRAHFFKKYGKPDSTFMVGHSMGGGITLAIMENFDKNYNAGLPLCPLASRPYLQCRKEYDLYATFNGLFPGVAPSLRDIFDLSKPYQAMDGRKMVAKANEIKAAIIKKDSALGVAFAKKYDLKFEDLPFSLFFNENVLRDIAQKAEGNPFDNTQTIYTGFTDNILVNQLAERLPATAKKDLFTKYDRTGLINKPVLLVHTIYDQLIPPIYGVTNFENMVAQQQKSKNLTINYTKGQGHCAFSPAQTGLAFDTLRHWTKTGKKATFKLID